MPPDNSVAFSFFTPWTQPDLVRLQRRVIDRWLPSGCPFFQLSTALDHGPSIDLFVAQTTWELFFLIDIDCIPLRPDSIAKALDGARGGALVGCAQRANHIENGGHVYAGPCALAFSRTLWNRAGRPSFTETSRGDTAEEFSFRCEERALPIELLWPTHVEDPQWDLSEGRRFGFGTTYGDAFYHCFQSGIVDMRERFRRRCFAVCPELEAEAAASRVGARVRRKLGAALRALRRRP
jgi:hypothetical protein